VRIKNWGWAALGSIALHISVLALLWPHTPLQQVSTQGTLIEVRLLTAPTVTVTPASNARPLPPPLKASRHHTIATSSPVAPQEEAPTTAPNLAGYLPIDAVDEPAVPLGDWAIDTDVLPRGYTLRMVLQLWISATGTMDQWTLVDDGGNAELAYKALATLSQTPIRPAQLHLTAVPSYRQLEVVLTRE
jgi:hypothetical protein